MGRRGAAAVVVVGAAIGFFAGPAVASPEPTTTVAARTAGAAKTTTTTTTTGRTTTTEPAKTTTTEPAKTTTTTRRTTTTEPAATTTDPATTTTSAPIHPTTEAPATSTPPPTDTTTTEATTTTVVEAPPSSTPLDDSTTIPADQAPSAAASAPPVGAEIAPDAAAAQDPVATLAQFAFVAFTPWRAAVERRAETSQALATLRTQPRADASALAAAESRLADARASVASLAPGYRFARDALADALVARAGRPPADAVALSAVWERTDPKRLAVVLAALMKVGDTYVFAAAGPDQFDCSGLTRYAWRTAGVDLVHYAVTQRQQTLDVTPPNLQPGDLVFRFRQPGGHVMLYLGVGDLVVQAGGTATGVAITSWGSVDSLGSPLAPSHDIPDAADDAAGPKPLFGNGVHPIAADLPFADAFNTAGVRYGVEPSLLAAIARVGTGFRADPATAAPGIGGLMQLRPAIAAQLGVDPANAADAIDGAARRLADLWNRLHDEQSVVAAYPSNLRGVNVATLVPDDDATRTYVAAVLAAARSTG